MTRNVCDLCERSLLSTAQSLMVTGSFRMVRWAVQHAIAAALDPLQQEHQSVRKLFHDL